MTWRVAKSLETLRQQINNAWPNRDKSSDGTIGDAAHTSRASDHNPHVRDGSMGVVTALDITHDPKNGVDSGAIAASLVQSRDTRIKYIISNSRIISGTDGPSPWVWRKYTGANPHTRHVHISVKAAKSFYDDTRPWSFRAPTVAAHTAITREDIRDVQANLIHLGYPEVGEVDGLIGGKTRGAITAFMNDRVAPMQTTVTPEVMEEIAKAKSQHWRRPIAVARALATAEEIAPKVEAVKHNRLSRFWSKVLAVPSAAGAAVWGAVDNIPDAHVAASPYILLVREYLGDIPGWVWLLLIASIGFAIWRTTNKSDAATVSDYQSGRLS